MPDPIPNRSLTNRGFATYDEFTDLYGATIHVRQSSLAIEPAVWIFAQRDRKDKSAHLSIEHAKRVRDALDTFIAENQEAPNADWH